MSSYVEFDVVVVGAGLTGLTVGYEILKRDVGLSVLILEENDNVGGKILEEGDSRAFFGCNYHENLIGLLHELNILNERVDDVELSKKLLLVTDKGARCERISRFATSQIYHFLKMLEWTSKRQIYKKYEGSETLGTNGKWSRETNILNVLKKWVHFRSARNFLIALLGSCCPGIESLGNVSTLWFLVMLNGAGGLFRKLSASLDPEKRFFVEGGFQRIVQRLEERIGQLGGTIRRRESVLSLERTPRAIIVTTNLQKFRCECVAVVIPPPGNVSLLQGSGISEEVIRSQRLHRPGRGMHFWCTYDQAFWKSASILVASGNEAGVKMLYSGPSQSMQNGKPNPLNGNRLLAGYSSSIPIECVPRYLNEIFVTTRAEEWKTQGESRVSSVNPAMSSSDRLLNPMFVNRDRRIFLAASEFARKWPGTADGAIEAGRRASGLLMWRARPQALRAIERIGYSREVVVLPRERNDDNGITIAWRLLLGTNVCLLLTLLKNVIRDFYS